jgi:predicted dehydrogenase
MLEGEQLDALIVATPSKLHAGMVEKGAQARACTCSARKPFVLDIADGERLVALAQSKGW